MPVTLWCLSVPMSSFGHFSDNFVGIKAQKNEKQKKHKLAQQSAGKNAKKNKTVINEAFMQTNY